MKLIDKDALVAEIKKLKEENKPNSKSISEYIKGGIYGFDLAIEKTLGILDSLEVKKVDLEKEIKDVWHDYRITDFCESNLDKDDIRNIANYFFELELKAQKGE